MDPSRNMSKYRQLVASEQTQPPIVSHSFITKLFFIDIYFNILLFIIYFYDSSLYYVDFKLLLTSQMIILDTFLSGREKGLDLHTSW